MPRPPRQDKQLKSLERAMKKVKLSGRGAYHKKRHVASGGAVRGRGFYKGFGSDIGKLLGGAVGGLVGHRDMGAKVGSWLGGKGAEMTGFGAYKVAHNSLVAQVPTIANPRKEGATQVRHREYIGQVMSSQDFKVQYALPINAAQPQTFPWLSQIAQNYTQYEVNGALFEFVSTSGDATGSNTALGTVVMATNYDSVLPAFNNKQQMLNQEFSTDAKPSINCIHPIECASNQTTIPLLYTRTGAVPANTDQRLYDLGVFYLATQGNQLDGEGNPISLGELWITYDVLLYKPLLGGAVGGSPSIDVAHFTLTNPAPGPTGAINAMLLGATPKVDSIGVNIDVTDTSNATITLQAGNVGYFKFDFSYWTNDYKSDYWNLVPSSFVNCEVVPIYNSVAGYGSPTRAEQLFTSATNVTAQNITYFDSFVINILDISKPSSVGMNVQHAPALANGNWKQGDLVISQISSKLV